MSVGVTHERVPDSERLALRVSFFALVFALGCESTCVDSDLDGYGPHCALGPDCDENNADRTDDCDVVPA